LSNFPSKPIGAPNSNNSQIILSWPFKNNPFVNELKISPLNTVTKRDSPERRVILDLSFPSGKSVNDHISTVLSGDILSSLTNGLFLNGPIIAPYDASFFK
jgi:hypothetical protein